MSLFAIYWLAGAPIFLIMFIHSSRKINDVTFFDLFGMILCSFIPFAREFILAWIIHVLRGSKPIFKKYEAK